jgi:hypothetical protein
MRSNRRSWGIAALCVGWVLALGTGAPAHAELSSFGSNGLTYNVGSTDLAKKQTAYTRLTGAGMNVVRVEFPWPLIQATSTTRYDWSSVDAYFAAMPVGVRAIALFMNAPTWARDTNQKTVCGSTSPMLCRMPPAESRLRDWQRFVQAALARYGSKIVAVEAWNEPNLVSFWRPRIDPARWARLMDATATAARGAMPGVTVISGGLVGGQGSDPTSDIGPIAFMQAAFAAVPRLAADIDEYGLHPYSRDDCGTAGAESWALQRDFTTDVCASAGWDVERMRWVVRNYDPGAPLAITEFGFSTGGPYGVDDATQSEWLTSAYDWFSAQPDVSRLVFHTLFDTSWALSADEAGYGLVDAANRPKAAWTAFHDRFAAGG